MGQQYRTFQIEDHRIELYLKRAGCRISTVATSVTLLTLPDTAKVEVVDGRERITFPDNKIFEFEESNDVFFRKKILPPPLKPTMRQVLEGSNHSPYSLGFALPYDTETLCQMSAGSPVPRDVAETVLRRLSRLLNQDLTLDNVEVPLENEPLR